MAQPKTAWRPSAPVVDEIIGWVRQAGHIALRHFTHSAPHAKADRSFVTQADLEIEDFLAGQLREAFPDHSLVAEEKGWGEIEPSGPIWVIDPLDGTTAFVQGLPGWGTSIGALHRGRPCFGLFYMPLTNDLTYTTSRGGVYANDHNLRQAVRRNWNAKGFLAVGASVHRDFQINIPRIRALGSIGASLAYTARGTAAAALLPRTCLWDIVAGAAILERAGGELCYLSGRPINYMDLLDGRHAPEPIIAGHPKLLPELKLLIRPSRGSTFVIEDRPQS
jgi:myo-inositol-1(or 4)-monophosphatase